MEEWFRWFAGVSISLLAGILAWLATLMLNLERRLIVLESKPYIDPIKYTEIMTTLTLEVARLTKEVHSLTHMIAKLNAEIEAKEAA